MSSTQSPETSNVQTSSSSPSSLPQRYERKYTRIGCGSREGDFPLLGLGSQKITDLRKDKGLNEDRPSSKSNVIPRPINVSNDHDGIPTFVLEEEDGIGPRNAVLQGEHTCVVTTGKPERISTVSRQPNRLIFHEGRGGTPNVSATGSTASPSPEKWKRSHLENNIVADRFADKFIAYNLVFEPADSEKPKEAWGAHETEVATTDEARLAAVMHTRHSDVGNKVDMEKDSLPAYSYNKYGLHYHGLKRQDERNIMQEQPLKTRKQKTAQLQEILAKYATD